MNKTTNKSNKSTSKVGDLINQMEKLPQSGGSSNKNRADLPKMEPGSVKKRANLVKDSISFTIGSPPLSNRNIQEGVNQSPQPNQKEPEFSVPPPPLAPLTPPAPIPPQGNKPVANTNSLIGLIFKPFSMMYNNIWPQSTNVPARNDMVTEARAKVFADIQKRKKSEEEEESGLENESLRKLEQKMEQKNKNVLKSANIEQRRKTEKGSDLQKESKVLGNKESNRNNNYINYKIAFVGILLLAVVIFTTYLLLNSNQKLNNQKR